MVRSMIPHRRYSLTVSEKSLATHLRGNTDLLVALEDLVKERIRGREMSPIPSDPVDCKATMAMDRELRWLLSRWDYIHNSPVNEDIGELPE